MYVGDLRAQTYSRCADVLYTVDTVQAPGSRMQLWLASVYIPVYPQSYEILTFCVINCSVKYWVVLWPLKSHEFILESSWRLLSNLSYCVHENVTWWTSSAVQHIISGPCRTTEGVVWAFPFLIWIININWQRVSGAHRAHDVRFL